MPEISPLRMANLPVTNTRDASLSLLPTRILSRRMKSWLFPTTNRYPLVPPESRLRVFSPLRDTVIPVTEPKEVGVILLPGRVTSPVRLIT
jgi:hypothetical protein